MGDLKVSQVRSGIGTLPKHRSTLRALGLGRIGKSNVLPDRPEIRGMLAKVSDLITVSDGGSAPTVSDGGSPPTVSDGGSPPTVSDGGSAPTAEEST